MTYGSLPLRSLGWHADDFERSASPVIDDLLGGLVGGEMGSAIRRLYFGRKLKRVEQGRTVRIRARAHPTDRPNWRLWRGAVVISKSGMRFRPFVRRWRTVDLSNALVVSVEDATSAAAGTRSRLAVAGVRRVDHLVVSPDGAIPIRVAIAKGATRSDRPSY
jgi:hypothetical protein